MADKAKHAYGSRKNLEAAIASGKVDAYDLLFLNGEGETPAIGWVDKDNNPVVIAPTDDLAALEVKVNDELSAKANTADVEASLSAKADASDVAELEKEVATKVDVDTVQSMIDKATSVAIEVVEF
jgi:hypothetical protein